MVQFKNCINLPVFDDWTVDFRALYNAADLSLIHLAAERNRRGLFLVFRSAAPAALSPSESCPTVRYRGMNCAVPLTKTQSAAHFPLTWT